MAEYTASAKEQACMPITISWYASVLTAVTGLLRKSEEATGIREEI